MGKCECLSGCTFFKRAESVSSCAQVFTKRYCNRGYTKCARYIVFKALGKSAVPVDLAPNMADEAYRVIAQHNKGHALEE